MSPRVDMGHIHYNELASDGRTIFMATRSTRQIEEGPAGFSIAAVDGRELSWRFKTLQPPWPFVLVTTPADRRLVAEMNHTVSGPLVMRAKAISNVPIAAVEVCVDHGNWPEKGVLDTQLGPNRNGRK